MMKTWVSMLAAIAGVTVCTVRVQTQAPAQSEKPVLYVTATAHLDSQWNWTVQDTIRQFVPNTFYTNFKYFEQYPDYVFTYEGAIHYMWFKEYHPEDWATLQKYVANGRWRLAGSWINAVDTNVPSPESLMRQALYGKRFFRQEFGKVANDVYLPDCFGFGFALPSVAMHSGLTAFSTQKLAPAWGPSQPVPFPIGRWKGPDGREVVAELRPGSYSTSLKSDISVDPQWTTDLTSLGDGRQVGFRLFGTGDVGGGPDGASVEWIEKAIKNPDATVQVKLTSADQLSRDLTAAQIAALPEYTGEMLMKTHGVGCYTSQAAMKTFNRQNELLADSAERAGVAARYFAGLPYPSARLRDAWTQVLWHQFHDDLTGTCIPQAYQFSWNDELASLNQFAGVLTTSTSAVASLLDTTGTGIPIVVYNPTSEARHEPVEATVEFPGAAPNRVHWSDAAGKFGGRAQVLSTKGHEARIQFDADMPPVGYKVFRVFGWVGQDDVAGGVRATATSLENARYTVSIDANGDIASILDRDIAPGTVARAPDASRSWAGGKELLKAPIRLEMRDDPSPDKPAWRILYDTVNAPAREYPAHPQIRIVENGPQRATIEVTRTAAGSTIVQRISLTDSGDRVDIEHTIDWKSPNTLLKVAFPFAASNAKATYDLGLGTIERGNNAPDLYEVPAQQWADVTDVSGAFGTAVLDDSKYGWDKPADNVLRLTLIHTPLPRAYPYQSSNDLGHHHFTYSIAGHRGDWRAGQVPARAAALNQPLVAFQTTAHAGTLGRQVSLATLSDTTGQFAIRAIKQAEDSDEVVVRLQELYGRVGHTTLTLAGRIASAREINAAEEAVGPLTVTSGGLALDFTPYQPRTVAVRLAPPAAAPPTRTTAPLTLPFNLDGVSTDARRVDGDFDGKKHTLAAELLPSSLQFGGVPFTLGSSAPGAMNVLVPKGQKLTVPAGSFDRLYLLAAAVGGDATTTIDVGSVRQALTVREWEGAIGQWDSPLKDTSALREPFVPSRPSGVPTSAEIRAGMIIPWDPQTFTVNPADIDLIRRGFVKRDDIAWVGTHRHAPDGNQTYIKSYVFAYAIDLPVGTRTVTLPNDDRVRILAATVVSERSHVRPASVLYAPDLGEPAVAPVSRTASIR